jgi:Transposase
MPKRNFSAEQIVTVLRQIGVLMAQDKAGPVACREAGVSQQSYYRWRKNYGGLELDQGRRMRRKKKAPAVKSFSLSDADSWRTLASPPLTRKVPRNLPLSDFATVAAAQ